jgi:hypothetical protein
MDPIHPNPPDFGDNIDPNLPDFGDNIDPNLPDFGDNIDPNLPDFRDNIDPNLPDFRDNIDPNLPNFRELNDHINQESAEYVDEENLLNLDLLFACDAGSGEVNFEYPDPVVYPAMPSSIANMVAGTASNTAGASEPLTFMSLPQDVRKKIYAMFLGPKTEVVIERYTDLPRVTKPVVSPTNLFLASRKVHREAASVFYGQTTFHMQHEYAIGYMTGRMGLENCKEVLHFTTFMHFVWNIPLTIKSVFPKLETLGILPDNEWYQGPWLDHLHNKHNGYYQAAIENAMASSRVRSPVGLRELMEMSKDYAVIINLPFWNNADVTTHPVVSISIHAASQSACHG